MDSIIRHSLECGNEYADFSEKTYWRNLFMEKVGVHATELPLRSKKFDLLTSMLTATLAMTVSRLVSRLGRKHKLRKIIS